MDPLTIRPFENIPGDRLGLVELVSFSFEHDRFVTDPLCDSRQLAFLFADGAIEAAEASLEDPLSSFCLLACRGDRVVGEAIGWIDRKILRYTGTRIGILWSLAVKESERRQGIAKALVLAAREWMEDHDCDQLSVSTDLGNPANALYQSLGLTRHHQLVTWTERLPVP